MRDIFKAAKKQLVSVRDYTSKEDNLKTFVRIQSFQARRTTGLLQSTRTVSFGLLILFGMSLTLETWLFIPKQQVSRITPEIQKIVGSSIPTLDAQLTYQQEARAFQFNPGYQAGGNTLGFGGIGSVTAEFPNDPSEGITLTDPVSGTSLVTTPLFELGNAEKDGSRVVYQMKDHDGLKVVSLAAIGYKEDLILNSYTRDDISFSYELEVPSNMDIRLESDGSIGFYSVENYLLGNVSTSNESDAELLSQARQNAERNNLVFRIPAPVVLDNTGNVAPTPTYFTLDGNIVTVHASQLDQLEYPISIDPSVYVETARKFMRGNNETNIDFDTTSELIQKGSTTGARFDSWTNTLDLNESRFDGASVTAGGYIYQVGGVNGTATENSTAFTSGTGNVFDIPAGVTSVTVELWGGGGGGGAGGSDGVGGTGGGGGYTTATLVLADLGITDTNDLLIDVGGGGSAGNHDGGEISGGGGGGGGHSEVRLSGGAGTIYAIAPGGGGGGGGDNSSSIAGGAGGAGGDDSDGIDAGASGTAGGGQGATSSAGGAGGTGGNNAGDAGGSESGGLGADGRSNDAGTNGAENNGGTNGGGDGGDAEENAAGYAGGGGGGSGYYGGGGGSGSTAGNAGGGGGGGGTGYADSNATATTFNAGSGTTPGNDADADRSGAADGGTAGAIDGNGGDGDAGRVVVKYFTAVVNTVEDTVYWANISDTDGTITQPNPGNGACTDWCTDTAYNLPDERRGHSMVAYNGFLYVIGGEDDTGTRQSTVYIAKLGANGEPSLWHPTDPDPDNWVYWFEDTSLPEAISYTAVVASNNRMYLLGGSTTGTPGGVTTVRYTNIEPTGELEGWTTTGVTALNTARFMHTAEVYNNNVYVIGGDSSSSGALLSSVDFIKLDTDGTFAGSWESTSGFSTARRTNGGDFTTIFGAYIYLNGGCSAVTGGNCQTVASDVQVASIFADGSLGEWVTIAGLSTQRVGYGMHAWQEKVYRVGGCTLLVTTSDDCVSSLDTVDYGTIYPPGEASTVSTSSASGTDPCTGGAAATTCNLPSSAVGNMLNASVILNGYLYIMGGCTNNACTSYSNGITYQAINSDGVLERPATCSGSFIDSYCDSSVSLPFSVGAPGVTTFNGRIYLVGGFPTRTNISHVAVNADGSLGSFTNTDFTDIAVNGIDDDLSYTFAYARANPANAGSVPGNLFIFGGCTGDTSGIGCSSYSDSVYKCNISTTGVPSNCTITGQTQIGTVQGASGSGLGAHAGAVYANYIYLMGGLAPGITDLTTVYTARFDDSNNVVEADGVGTANWTLQSEEIEDGRRRGAGFGYNGYLYITGGYDGTEALADIEFAKINVSDGSIEAFVDSSVSIDRRWGLTAPVSNSFAYVIGGCTEGPAPSGCTTRTDTIQTFQIYNNDSGTLKDATESAGNFAATNDRIGSSAAIIDGYIYVAGGENSGTVTNNVQFAPLNPNGSIGTWASTTATLPSGRAYGQLEAVGGDLYYIGGEDTAGDEKSEVYYASPTTGAAVDDVIRTTTYKLNNTEYSTADYTLTLNQDLETNYFVMIVGGSDVNSNTSADVAQVRLDGDPFGNIGTTTNSDEILLSRGSATNNWVGSITVVECVSACTTDGFQLEEVLDISLADNNTSTDTTLASAHTSQTVPFGGYRGGGLETTGTGTGDFSPTAGVRIRKNSTNQIRVERDTTNGNPDAADLTVHVVEWGSNWTVYESNLDAWSNGGQGVDIAAEYSTQCIDETESPTCTTTVNRDNTWLWKSPGTSTDHDLGDGSFGKAFTLGDGEVQNATESEFALGTEITDGTRSDTVYIMEHTDLAVDYQFVTRANLGASFTDTVDTAIESESVNTVGDVTSSAGYRIPQWYYSDSGGGTGYPRAGSWSHYHSNDTTISFAKSRTGNNQAGWVQSVDFGNNAGSLGGGDITAWSTASGGIGDTDSQAAQDRTRFGAAVWNDRIYVVGGLNDSGTEVDTVFYTDKLSNGGDIAANSWNEATVNTPDVARSGGALISYANNLYYLGGNDGTNYLSDVQFASIGYKTGTISQSGNTITGSGTTFTSDMVGSTIQYVTDGSTATITSFTSATSIDVDVSKTVSAGETFSIDDGSVGDWTFSTSLPQYVSDADGFAENGFMYLIGGRSAASTCTNNTYVAPISANTTIATGNNPTGVGEWYQTNVEYTGDRYSAGVAFDGGKVYITGGGCGTELTSNQHWYATLRSQPQVANYSYYIDADTNIFPNAWLLNGLDNNIGARWQFDYRSSADTPNVLVNETFEGTNGVDLSSSNTIFDSCFEINGGGTANASFDSTYANRGATSAEFSVDGGTSYTGCYETHEDLSERYYRFYFRPEAYTGLTATTPFFSLYDTPAFDIVGALRFQADGDIEIRDGNSTETTWTAPTADTWHRMEVGVVNDQMTVRLYRDSNLNGVTADDSITFDLDDVGAPDTWNETRIGINNNPNGDTWELNFDDYKTSATGFVGSNELDWGQNTAFGDVTLGSVEDYTPLDTSGVDTNFARYIYVGISIDASQTFGYPDDVTRGPTIDDFTLFFVSDPNKRLRHGKTFIQGQQQPLDTPPPGY